jgi:cytochrome c-type biogenesis protein CcmI
MAAVLLTALAVFLLLQPILGGVETSRVRGEEPSEAQFRKRVSLLQLRDAEYEYAMGKLGEEDYQALRQELSAEALAAIRAEESEGDPGSSAGQAEAEDLEAEIAAVRARLRQGTFCPECGIPNPVGSRFCSECGYALASVHQSSQA